MAASFSLVGYVSGFRCPLLQLVGIRAAVGGLVQRGRFLVCMSLACVTRYLLAVVKV